MSTTTTETETPTTVEDLKAQLKEAKAEASAARAAQKAGTGSADAVNEAKRKVDRITAAIRRAEKANGSGSKSTGKSGGSKSTGKKADPKPREPKAEAKITVAEKRVAANKSPQPLTRQPKGAKLRVTRRNRKYGVHISVVDATQDNRFKSNHEGGRWVVLIEETGQHGYVPTWEACGRFITDPSTWADVASLEKVKADREAAKAKAAEEAKAAKEAAKDKGAKAA